MLRAALLVIAALAIAGGIALFLLGAAFPLLALYPVAWGVVVGGAVLIERSGYLPTPRGGRGPWEPTDERFIDPTSGRPIVVEYNPRTGERRYVDRGEHRASP